MKVTREVAVHALAVVIAPLWITGGLSFAAIALWWGLEWLTWVLDLVVEALPMP